MSASASMSSRREGTRSVKGQHGCSREHREVGVSAFLAENQERCRTISKRAGQRAARKESLKKPETRLDDINTSAKPRARDEGRGEACC